MLIGDKKENNYTCFYRENQPKKRSPKCKKKKSPKPSTLKKKINQTNYILYDINLLINEYSNHNK
jgi:hypothetical protein